MVGGGLRMKKITVGWLEIGKKERKAINRVLDSGRISEGEKVAEFERQWAAFVGTKFSIAVSSGTAALITALTALKHLYKLKGHAKVITSPLTYISDVNAIVLSGFEPAFVDIDPVTFGITAAAIERYLKNDMGHSLCGIILPVDLMGYSVKIDEIKAVAKKYRLLVLEDAAQAHGTTYRGKRCGSNADAGIFSFYIAHNIQAGEMGAITTNDIEIYRLSKKLKANGRACECRVCTRFKGRCPKFSILNGSGGESDPRFLHDIIGYNFKTMELPAAIALVQLQKAEAIIKKRRDNVLYLNKGLEKFKSLLQLPFYQDSVSYLAYPIVIKSPDVISRIQLEYGLEQRGIETRPLFGCIPTQQPAYADLKNIYRNRLPHAEYIGKNGFYIGCHQYLDRKDLDRIIDGFGEVLESKV